MEGHAAYDEGSVVAVAWEDVVFFAERVCAADLACFLAAEWRVCAESSFAL